MTAAAASSHGAAAGSGGGAVPDLDRLRITRALSRRARYRYVHPRVERDGGGWTILCANCSRNIRSDGGEIAIASFTPAGSGRWALHARDHGRGAWVCQAEGLTLAQALQIVCTDSARVYWP